MPTHDALGWPATALLSDQDCMGLAGDDVQLPSSFFGLRLFRPPRA